MRLSAEEHSLITKELNNDEDDPIGAAVKRFWTEKFNEMEFVEKMSDTKVIAEGVIADLERTIAEANRNKDVIEHYLMGGILKVSPVANPHIGWTALVDGTTQIWDFEKYHYEKAGFPKLIIPDEVWKVFHKALYITMDSSGDWYGYSELPQFDDNGDWHLRSCGDDSVVIGLGDVDPSFFPKHASAENSLIRRPDHL